MVYAKSKKNKIKVMKELPRAHSLMAPNNLGFQAPPKLEVTSKLESDDVIHEFRRNDRRKRMSAMSAQAMGYKTPTKDEEEDEEFFDDKTISDEKPGTAEKSLDLQTDSDLEDFINIESVEETMIKVLKQFKVTYVPLDFFKEGFTYYKFHGVVGKQSKIMKSIMERVLEIDIKNLHLIEYKSKENYPHKSNRVSPKLF